MARRTSKAIKINVRKKPEGLVDPKLVTKKRDFSRVIALSTILGFLVGGFGIAYILFSNNPLNLEVSPEIIVPENEEVLQEEQTETATTTLPDTEAPQVVIQQVEILDTPTGYLNVRAGAGTNFEKITRVKPGEFYEFVSEDTKTGWYQIRLDITTTGWITKRYAKVK